MKYLLVVIFISCSSMNLLFSQEKKVGFEVDNMLYYENENCYTSNLKDKYTVIYQDFYNPSKYVVYHLNSFNDENIILYIINQNKLLHYEILSLAEYNAASRVELLVSGKENIDDLSLLDESNIKLKFIEKESVIRDNRMLTAYRFKAKNFDKAEEIVYYIDHAGSGVPFSFHKSFFDEMKKEGFPLIGNVVQRDEINENGNTCSYVLKSNQKPNKEFSLFFN